MGTGVDDVLLDKTQYTMKHNELIINPSGR